jgi:hypothetical protein
MSQLKRNLLHYAIATVTGATTFNQKNCSESTIATIFGSFATLFRCCI